MRANRSFLLIAIVTLLFALACAPERKDGVDDAAKRGDNSILGKKTGPAQGPSDIVLSYLSAIRDRRYEEAKTLLSRQSLANLTAAAAEGGTSFDHGFKQAVDNDADMMAQNNTKSFETRNEQINGDRATVEVKADNASQFARTSLVNEDGYWRIILDETTEAGANPTPKRQ